MRAALAVCALLFALAANAVAPAAETPTSDDARTRWAYDLANDLLSPFCPGRSLADCPSSDAASLRMWILVQAAAGRSRADVEEELYARYGEVIRAKPKAEGFGTAAYVIPVAVFAAGGTLAGWFLHRATRRARSHEPAIRDLDPEVERKLDELLARGEHDGDDAR
jgi:cytochrome c-type biogenesis protein CcmH